MLFWKILNAVETLVIIIIWICVKQVQNVLKWKNSHFSPLQHRLGSGNALCLCSGNALCFFLIDWLKVAEDKWTGHSVALSDFYDLPLDKIVRIFNDCEVRIENSVTRVSVRHHKACLVFNSHWTTIIDSFSCILFLWQLYLSLNMHYFINFALK